MIEVIPAINAETFKEVERKIRIVEPFAKWVHIDVADGTFTDNVTWHNPKDLSALNTLLNIEVHLMVDAPEDQIESWLIPQVKRVIFHPSASKTVKSIIEACKEGGVEVGLAIEPAVSWTDPLHHKDKTDVFQLLGVTPGRAGQKFDEATIEKIREVRHFCDSCVIEADGGMNTETARKAVEAGANIIVSASAIFESNDPKRAAEELRELANGYPPTADAHNFTK